MRYLAFALLLAFAGCGTPWPARAACNPLSAPTSSLGCQAIAVNPVLTDTLQAWQPEFFPASNRQLSIAQLFGMAPQLTATGMGLPSWTTLGRPTPPYPSLGFNVTTDALDVWTGATYLSFTASNWQLGVVNALATGLTLSGTTLTPQWQAGAIATLGAGLSGNNGTLVADWRGGLVATLDPALSIAGGALTPQWRAGVVTTLGAGLALDPATHTLSAAAAAQWQAGTVTTLGTGLSLDSITHTLSASGAVQQWTAGSVATLATGLTLNGTQLTPQWRAGTVTALGTDITAPSGVLHGQWQAGTVTTLGSGVSLNTATNTLSATGNWSTGNVTAVASPGLSIVGTTLTPQWAGGTVAGLGAEMTISSGLLRSQWRAGQVTGLTGLSIDINGNLVASASQWTAGTVTSLGTEITAPSGVLHTQWSAGAVTTLGNEFTAPAGVLHTQWAAGAVNTIGAGLVIATGGVLQASTGTAQWNAGVVNTLAPGLTIPAGTQVLTPNWQGPLVTSLGTEFTTAGNVLHTQWAAGQVSIIGSGLNLDGVTHTLTATGAQQWTAGNVAQLATGVQIIGGTTLTPNWQAASVTSLGTEITAPAGVLHTQWSAGIVTTIGSGLTLNPATNTLTATGVQQWTAGNVSALGTGISIVGGTTLTPQWQAGAVTSLGADMTAPAGILHGQWQVGTVTTLGAGLTLDPVAHSLSSAASQWTAGTVSTLATGLTIVGGATLTPQWQAGAVTSLGGDMSAPGGVLHGQWQAGSVTTVGSGLNLNAGVLTATLTVPLTIAQGGSGATTQAGARSGFGIDTLNTAGGSITLGCFGSYNTNGSATNATFTLASSTSCNAGSRIVILDAGQVVSDTAPLTVLPAANQNIIIPGNKTIGSIQCSKKGGYFELINDPANSGWDLGPQGCAQMAVNDNGTTVSFSEPVTLTTSTVAALPLCNSAAKGWIATVSDATAVTFNATPAGGGSLPSLVMCSGTAWTTR